MNGIAIAAMVAVAATASAVSAQTGRSQPVKLSGSPAAAFGPDNYPPVALRNGEQGRVVAKLQVGADGHVSDCTVTESSGSPSLDAGTCRIARSRVFFTPATDASGRPISSVYVLPVSWMFPIELLWPFEKWNVAADINTNGQEAVVSCKARGTGGQAHEGTDPCNIARDLVRDRGLKLRDASGVWLQNAVIAVTMSPGVAMASRPTTADAVGVATMQLTINPSGTVVGCEPLGRTGVFTSEVAICGIRPGPFVPSPAGSAAVERKGTLTISVSHPRKPTG